MIQNIRKNMVFLITPIVEVDGHDRMVDWTNYRKAYPTRPQPDLVYWGHYVQHDNNRDSIGMGLKLSQVMMKNFLEWHPQVLHDLHESEPYLYISTGTGPYNAWLDPIVVSEWQKMAYNEVEQLTEKGVDGVWTHGFYDGWAPNYTILSVASLHNSIGRFYETYTSLGAECHTVHLPTEAVERHWDRMNPPVNGVRWCIRSNINYQQSGVLIALRYVADNRQTFLENYAAKVDRMIRRGRTTAPYAYVIPHDQRHAGEAAALVNLFRAQGTTVDVATADFSAVDAPRPVEVGGNQKPTDPAPPPPLAADSVRADSMRRAAAKPKDVSVHRGDWIVRMDQPSTATVRTLLATQRFGANEPPPYDDTGWTLDLLRHVITYPIGDSAVFGKPMQALTADAEVVGTITDAGASSSTTRSSSGETLIIRNNGEWRTAVLPWAFKGAVVAVAESAFTVSGQQFPAGTFLVSTGAGDKGPLVKSPSPWSGVTTSQTIAVKRHSVTLPRIALMHSWLETQNEGWVRYAFDQMGIPYTYISDQSLRKAGALDRFDVVIFPHVNGSPSTLLNGRPMIGPAIPWKKTPETPNLGLWDETDDLRPGMGLAGATALRQFVERGGLLITEGGTSTFAVSLGLNPTLQMADARTLRAQGSILRAQLQTRDSPILYGYEDVSSFPVYFGGTPALAVQQRDSLAIIVGVDSSVLREAESQRAKVIVRFYPRADSLLLSGLLVGGTELIGKAAVIDAPVGKGHVVLFAIRPLWRWESQGTFALVLNAMANWNALSR